MIEIVNNKMQSTVDSQHSKDLWYTLTLMALDHNRLQDLLPPILNLLVCLAKLQQSAASALPGPPASFYCYLHAQLIFFELMSSSQWSSPRKKSVKERAEEAALSEVLHGDFLRTMRLEDDPVACRKYLADMAAGDIEKYSPLEPKYRSMEETLNSPITPANQCGFCDGKPEAGKNLLRCSRCKVVRYCGRDCQSKDWKFHKKGCALILSD